MARPFRPEAQAPTFALTEGMALAEVWMSPDHSIKVGRLGVASITVQMEPGQMGLVPWARLRYDGGTVRLVNLAHAERVEFLDRLPVMPDEDEEGGGA